jgi:hypothetical protein
MLACYRPIGKKREDLRADWVSGTARRPARWRWQRRRWPAEASSNNEIYVAPMQFRCKSSQFSSLRDLYKVMVSKFCGEISIGGKIWPGFCWLSSNKLPNFFKLQLCEFPNVYVVHRINRDSSLHAGLCTLLRFGGPQLYNSEALSFTYGQYVNIELADKLFKYTTVCFCPLRKYVSHIGLKREPNVD